MMIVGAVGTGKTSACMYPYAEQLLRWRAADPDWKIGGLVLEVKGDFCQRARHHRAGRESDYAEIRLGGDICYNPLHNDLDPYAVAFAIATLVNNLFGKSKEPFWQQATGSAQVRHPVAASRRRLHDVRGGVPLHPRRQQDRERDQRAEDRAESAARGHRGSLANYELQVVGIPWTNWFRGPGHMAHQHSADLDSPCTSARFRSRFGERKGPRGSSGNTSWTPSTGWFTHGWRRLDHRPGPPSPKESSCFLAVRREPGSSSDVLPTEKRMLRRRSPVSLAR